MVLSVLQTCTACLLFFASFKFSTCCPNEQFHPIANYKEPFSLDAGQLYYIAIGSKEDGRWGIGILQPLAHLNEFHCHRENLGVGAPYARKKQEGTVGRKRVTNTKCCYANAQNLVTRAIGADYAILPDKVIRTVVQSALERKGILDKIMSAASESIPIKNMYYWYQSQPRKNHHRFLALVSTQDYSHVKLGKQPFFVPKVYGPFPEKEEEYLCATTHSISFEPTEPIEAAVASGAGKLRSIDFDFEPEPLSAVAVTEPSFRIEKSVSNKCQFSEKAPCDTGIISDIVGFIYDTVQDGATRISFGYSDDGMFNLNKFLPDMKAADANVYYFPISDWWNKAGENRPTFKVYGEWLLGSSCSACPSTSMKISISEKEAAMNKQRFEHALSLGLSGKYGIGMSAGYTFKNIKESAATLTSGRATTVSASCNGYYLYYWGIAMGAWGIVGTDKIPTQRFYCTDWPIKPVCLPNVNGMELNPVVGAPDGFSEEDIKKVCKGDDDKADFCGPATSASDACNALEPSATKQHWWSKHQGRPQPVRVVGHDTVKGKFTPLKTKPVVASSAKYMDIGDYLMKNEYGNTKGIFDGDVYFHDDKQQLNYDVYSQNSIGFNYDNLYDYNNDAAYNNSDMIVVLLLVVLLLVCFGLYIGCFGFVFGIFSQVAMGYFIRSRDLKYESTSEYSEL